MRLQKGLYPKLYLMLFSLSLFLTLVFFIITSPAAQHLPTLYKLLFIAVTSFFVVLAVTLVLFNLFGKFFQEIGKMYNSNIFFEEVTYHPVLKFLGLSVFFDFLEKQNQKLRIVNLENQLLYDTSLAIHKSTSLQQLLDTVIANLTKHIKADFGLVYILKDHRLLLASRYNLPENITVRHTLRIGEGLVGWTVQEGRAVLSREVSEDERYADCVHGTRSIMTIPMKIIDSVTGVLVLGSLEKDRFKENDLVLLQAIASEVGLAVKSTWLKEELEKEKELIAALYPATRQIAANIELEEVMQTGVEAVKNFAGASSCSIMLYDEEAGLLKIAAASGLPEETKETVKLKPGEGVAGKVYLDMQSIQVDSVAREPRFKVFPGQNDNVGALYSAPLLTEDGCIGTINVATTEPLPENTLKPLDVLISQLSAAMDKALLYRSIKEMALRDGLTGPYNYLYFQQVLAAEVERTRRYQRNLSLAIIGIDNFKTFNDTHGHVTGDYLLRELGRVLMDNCRSSDTVARYGGDKIAVILPETDGIEAYALMDRLKTLIAASEFGYMVSPVVDNIKGKGVSQRLPLKIKLQKWLSDIGLMPRETTGTLKVTISAGICSLSNTVTSKEDLISKADQALLEAKESGKNRVFLWRAETPGF